MQGICILHQGPDHRFDLAENPPPSWSQRDPVGGVEADILPTEVAALFAAAFERVRSTGEEQSIEFEIGEGLRRRYFEARLLADQAGVTTIVTDTTDERARDFAVASLLREVSHRSKNLLAIVQSVAMQTAHHSGSIKDFLDRFRGRLHALSSTQDLVTESNWRGTYLQSLIASQLTRVGHAILANVRVTGENPRLGPNASLHIGLAIHELGANAVLHGAIADGGPGQVWIDARIVHQLDQPPQLVIEWQETGIDIDLIRHEPHFGTLVLERIVPLSVGGSADFRIEADSVRYRLVVPADQFES
jgi:two-component sensor histidine kinase